MKIVHTADLHIGMETHGPIDPHTGLPRRLEDFLRALDVIVDTAIEESADLVIMAGDIYKSRDPNPTHQRAFARRVLKLSQQGIPVFLLAGNHDIPNAVSRATSIDIFHELEVSNVTVARKSDIHRIETRSGPVLIASLPWITRATLLMNDANRSVPSSELDRAIVEHIGDVVAELADEITVTRSEPALAAAPAILVAHVHAQEAKDGAERALTVGSDPLVPVNRLSLSAFDYVALGHIHAHQQWPSKPPVVYPGSIERVNFGEENEDKGFMVVDLARGSCTPDFRTTHPRRFLTIDVNATTDDPTIATLRQIERNHEKIPDAVVRVRVKLAAHNEAFFDEPRVRAALGGAFWVSEVYRNVDRPERPHIAGSSIEGKTPMELLDEYFAAKQVPTDERERLRGYASRLLSSVS